MSRLNFNTQAPNVSTIWAVFESIKDQIQVVTKESNFSDALVYSMLKDFADRQLLQIQDNLYER